VRTQYRRILTGRLTAQHRAVRARGSFGRRICARCESTSQHHDMMSHMSGVRTTSGFDGGAGVDSRGRDVAGDLATSAGVLTTRLIIVTCNGAVAFGALNGGKTVAACVVHLSGLHGAWCTGSAWSQSRSTGLCSSCLDYMIVSAATVTYLSEASATVRCFTAAASRPQVRWVNCGLFVNVISGLAGVVRMVSLRNARQTFAGVLVCSSTRPGDTLRRLLTSA
jgi:hypothetical protein